MKVLAILALAVGLESLGVSVYSYQIAKEPAACAIFAGSGLVFFLAAWYCWKQTPESLNPADPPLWFGGAFVIHRRELERAAQACLAVTVVCLAAFCFGNEQLLRMGVWPLIIASAILDRVARNSASRAPESQQDWLRVPGPLRMLMQGSKKALTVLFFVYVALRVASLQSEEHSGVYLLVSWIAIGCDIALLFALEALFFRYGELRPISDAPSN